MKKYDLDEKSWVIQDDLPQMQYDFEQLWSLHPEKLGQIKIYNRLINTPRWTQCYGKSYGFSGILHEAMELPEEFEQFKIWANSLGFGTFDQILINWYQDGNHYIGTHADNEPQIVKNSAILSISLGAERTFRIRSKYTNEVINNIAMTDKSYVVMGGEMQKHFTHEVPKVANSGKRINITFRIFKK